MCRLFFVENRRKKPFSSSHLGLAGCPEPGMWCGIRPGPGSGGSWLAVGWRGRWDCQPRRQEDLPPPEGSTTASGWRWCVMGWKALAGVCPAKKREFSKKKQWHLQSTLARWGVGGTVVLKPKSRVSPARSAFCVTQSSAASFTAAVNAGVFRREAT